MNNFYLKLLIFNLNPRPNADQLMVRGREIRMRKEIRFQMPFKDCQTQKDYKKGA